MSGVLRKPKHALDHTQHSSLPGIFVPISMLILILAIVVAVLGHFSPAR